MQKSVLIIGAGKLGLSLYCALRETPSFSTLFLVGRSRSWHDFLAAQDIQLSNLDIALENPPDFIFICTQDAEIASVCQHLTRYGKTLTNTHIIHCSGALSLEALASLAEQGCRIGGIHPLKAFPIPIAQQAFQHCPVAIEGLEPVAKELETLATALGAHPFHLQLGSKAKYHAAACIASNYLVTLAHISTSLFMETGISALQSRTLTQALMSSSLEQVKRCTEYHEALSGPIERGDAQTVVGHMLALSDSTFMDGYAELGKLSLSLTKHDIDKRTALLQALESINTLPKMQGSCEIAKV